jgi:hypothetical protein
MAEAPKQKKTRVRKTAAATITEQAKKLSLTELIAHFKEVSAEIDNRKGQLAQQLELANSI